MTRISLTDGSGRWFDQDAASRYVEAQYFDGRNMISRATGSQWEHQALYRTSGGRWILHAWSQWQGSSESYTEISGNEPAGWLIKNEHQSGKRMAWP